MFSTESNSGGSNQILMPPVETEGNVSKILDYVKNVGIKELGKNDLGYYGIVFYDAEGRTINKPLYNPFEGNVETKEKRVSVNIANFRKTLNVFVDGSTLNGLSANTFEEFESNYSWGDIIEHYAKQMQFPTPIIPGSQLKVIFKSSVGDKRQYIVSNQFPIANSPLYPQAKFGFDPQRDILKFTLQPKEAIPSIPAGSVDSSVLDAL